jgi:hypothetical protein
MDNPTKAALYLMENRCLGTNLTQREIYFLNKFPKSDLDNSFYIESEEYEKAKKELTVPQKKRLNNLLTLLDKEFEAAKQKKEHAISIGIWDK